MAKTPKTPPKPETRLVNAGRDPKAYYGFVNPPVYHASTVLYPTAADQVAHRARYSYGRRGTPTSEALENALREIEGDQCAGVALLPSGLAAISTALLAVAGAGDHILVSDSVYRPTRTFCDGVLKRMGVTTTYYDPLIGAGIANLFKPNTKAVFVEAPGSQSFEMQDIPAIAKVAHDKGALVLMDNTWATPLYFKRVRERRRSVDPGRHQIYRRPFRHHVRLRVGQRQDARRRSRTPSTAMGLCVGPDDMYLALRGLRTMGVRLARHYQSGLEGRALARGAAGSRARAASRRSKAIPVTPSGSATSPAPAACSASCSSRRSEKAVYAFMDELTLFGMGFSWGGFESLVISFDCAEYRTATPWAAGRADAALPHRPGRPRRSDRRSRRRLCRDGGGEIDHAGAPCPPLRMTNCRLRR